MTWKIDFSLAPVVPSDKQEKHRAHSVQGATLFLSFLKKPPVSASCLMLTALLREETSIEHGCTEL